MGKFFERRHGVFQKVIMFCLFCLTTERVFAESSFEVMPGHYVWHEWQGAYRISYRVFTDFRDEVEKINHLPQGEGIMRKLKIGTVLRLPDLSPKIQVTKEESSLSKDQNSKNTKVKDGSDKKASSFARCTDVVDLVVRLEIENRSLKKENEVVFARYKESLEIVSYIQKRVTTLEKIFGSYSTNEEKK